jgi:hypothetical protein
VCGELLIFPESAIRHTEVSALPSAGHRNFVSGAYTGIEVRYASAQEGRRP